MFIKIEHRTNTQEEMLDYLNDICTEFKDGIRNGQDWWVTEKCPKCGGTGKVPYNINWDSSTPPIMKNVACDYCKGWGDVIE